MTIPRNAAFKLPLPKGVPKPFEGVYTVDYPAPPSVNALWYPADGKMMRSVKYKTWMRACDAYSAPETWPPREPLAGPLEVTVRIPCGRKRDIDNYLKACLDRLAHDRIIADDRHVERLVAFRSAAQPKGTVSVTVAVMPEGSEDVPDGIS